MSELKRVVQGRGAVTNPPNRFDRLVYERDEEAEADESSPNTIFLRDPTRTILAKNDSPDVGFERSINPYRGCEHGCVYCFAGPTHEYLGFSAGLDFETRILVKEDAPSLLREEHFPDRKEKVLNRVRDMRGGNLNDPKWGVRKRGEGIFAEQVRSLFTVASRKAGIEGRSPHLSVESFRKPAGPQQRLF